MTFDKLKPGDTLVLKGVGYHHYAILVENYNIITTCRTVSGTSHDPLCGRAGSSAIVQKTRLNLGDFDGIQNITISSDDSLDRLFNPLPPYEIVQRAESMICKMWESREAKNCEHFAKWCRYGEAISQQVPHAFETKNAVGAGVGSVPLGPVLIDGPNAQAAVRNDKGHIGVVAQATAAAAEVGPVRAELGVGVSTGVHASDGSVGVELLGTGITVGRTLKLSYFGSSIGVRLW